MAVHKDIEARVFALNDNIQACSHDPEFSESQGGTAK
jgi:hypothetical protein